MTVNGARRGRKERREGTRIPRAASFPQCNGECEAEYWRRKYEGLRDRMLEVGFTAIDMLDEKQKYGLVVMQYLREKHGELKVSTESLNTLKPEVKREAMDYLYAVLGGDPRRKDIVHEVFRTARQRRQDCFKDYG